MVGLFRDQSGRRRLTSRDLYIQAMVALQSIPEDDELSYFALSGGLPP